MSYIQKHFPENELAIKNKKFKYYLSPILIKNNFKHGFFTKISSEIDLSFLSSKLNLNYRNCVLNQIHSNRIVFGSKTQGLKRAEADGMVCDKDNQNLWIYTADCMPILFADKRKRIVAAIHCGRKGLENRIINNLIKIFENLGTAKEDLLVAIGPSISKKNYLIDQKTLWEFYKEVNYKEPNSYSKDGGILFNLKNLVKFKNKGMMPIDLKKYAHIQLLSQNIPNKNIDISRLCTFESNHDFYSWRRSKTFSRQWNFISM